MPERTAQRTYLELRSPEQLNAVDSPAIAATVTIESPCDVALSRTLYREVGEQYHWRDRDRWTDAQLAERLGNPNVAVHIMRTASGRAGYFELERHDDGSVEITLFGLLPAAIGRGLGKWMLTEAAQAAWAMGANRVWLHTCSLDSPHALPNYIARGFAPFGQETYTVDLPDDAP